MLQSDVEFWLVGVACLFEPELQYVSHVRDESVNTLGVVFCQCA